MRARPGACLTQHDDGEAEEPARPDSGRYDVEPVDQGHQGEVATIGRMAGERGRERDRETRAECGSPRRARTTPRQHEEREQRDSPGHPDGAEVCPGEGRGHGG